MKYHILLINASDEKNIPKVLEIKNLRLRLTLVNHTLPEWIKPYVDSYLECDLKNLENTLSILKEFSIENPFHGAITFWDREVEVTAAITNYFNLPGPTIQSMTKTKNKLLMRDILAQNNISQARYHKVITLEDLKNAATDLGYPFIFKPVAASASAGVFKIHNHSELTYYYNCVQALNKPEFWLYPHLYIAEEYMQGNEVSVEGVINQGKIFIAGITQKWKTENSFVEWQHCFPANLTKDIEEKIYRYIEQCIIAVGLNNIAFHIELINQHDKIKMVEINARMGGDFITSYLLPLCGVNIAKAAIQTALGMPCSLDHPEGYACVRFLLTEIEGNLKHIENRHGITKNNVIKFALLKNINDAITLPPAKFADNRLCYVITHDTEFGNCITSAENFLNDIKFAIE